MFKKHIALKLQYVRELDFSASTASNPQKTQYTLDRCYDFDDKL